MKQNILVVLLSSAVCFTSMATPAGRDSSPKTGVAHVVVDETLFLVRVLENLYEQWPVDAVNATEFVNAASELRREALRFRNHIDQQGLSRELGMRYSDLIDALDAYTAFLNNIGVIEANALNQQSSDMMSSGYKAGAAGATAYKLTSSGDSFDGGVALASLAFGALTYAVDSWSKSSARDQAVEQAVLVAAQKVSDVIDDALLKAQATAEALAKEQNWSAAEIGWDLSESRSDAISRMVERGDMASLVRMFRREMQLRPRDPFIRIGYYYLQSLMEEESAEAIASYAQNIYYCQAMIPQHSVYDEYRAWCASFAALVADSARSLEYKQGVNIERESPIGKTAVTYWRKALELSPYDSGGHIRQGLAFSLMTIGSLSEAQGYAEVIAGMRSDDAGFCYNYACLLSRCQNTDMSLQYLERAIDLGFYEVNWARKDPDLKYLRHAKSVEIAKLLNPQTSWQVTNDWLWDDVCLDNNSLFPITNIKLTVNLVKGARVESHTLTCDYIPPGDRFTWADVVNGVEGAWDMSSSTASLACDQN